jgi:predicted TIM-barrel fold metal-dependent hydrolase
MEPIDFSAHIHPDASFPEFDDIIGDLQRDPELLEKMFETVGMKAVLSEPYHMGQSDLEGTKKANDKLLNIVKSSDRFYGLAAVPTAAGGEDAAVELERSLSQGFNGGAIETKTEGIELVDSDVEPIFEVCVQQDAPLLVHPKPFDSLTPDSFDETYQLNSIFGREMALSESMCKVVHEDILESYPGLKLVYHHCGGNIASMLGRVHLRLDNGRWPRQEHVKDYPEFKHQLEQLYIDTSGFYGYRMPLRNAFEEFPTSQVLFGTDAPYEPRDAEELAEFEEAVRDVTSNRDSDKVLAENAKDIMINT